VLSKFYNIHKQEDAHELFIHILDKLDEAEKKAHRDPKLKTIISKIFGGECRQSITCTMEDCGHISHTSQVFMDLSLDLLVRDRDILSSLEDFTRSETLSHDNQYKCEKYALGGFADLDVIRSLALKRKRRFNLRRRFCRFI
jgi:ubiquitin C-terminal hydrolase